MAEPQTTTLNEDENDTVQSLLQAINELPGVRVQVEAYMRGQGDSDPTASIEAIHAKVF